MSSPGLADDLFMLALVDLSLYPVHNVITRLCNCFIIVLLPEAGAPWGSSLSILIKSINLGLDHHFRAGGEGGEEVSQHKTSLWGGQGTFPIFFSPVFPLGKPACRRSWEVPLPPR